MKKSGTEKLLVKFMEQAQNRGATKEELDIVAEAIEIVKKYLPFYKKES